MNYFEKHSFPGNCGMAILVGFSSEAPTSKGLDDDLRETFRDSNATIVAFSGNTYQEKEYDWGPKQFADWLKKKGEKVTRTARTFSHCSGNKIQAFYWIPSLKFRKKYGMDISDTSEFY